MQQLEAPKLILHFSFSIYDLPFVTETARKSVLGSPSRLREASGRGMSAMKNEKSQMEIAPLVLFRRSGYRLRRAIAENRRCEMKDEESQMENVLIYTHVLNRGPSGVRSPADSL